MIDLHCHSTYSDGSLTPAELVARAVEAGLTALALTDHDGTGGVGPLREACAALPPTTPLLAIPGVEISAEVERGAMHLLGYFIDCAHGGLQEALTHIRTGREERNRLILGRLHELGFAMTWEEVAANAGEDVVGRPHFAQAMVARGYVNNKQKAFERFLARGKAAYVERFRFAPADAIRLITEAGGVAVLAHPGTLDLSTKRLRQQIGELKKIGLGGIEVYYSTHAPEQEGLFAAVAREWGLVATGGSDFHGSGNPGIKLGRGFGSLHVPDEVVEQLRARAGRGA